METTELEFEHYLAEKLGRTVGELRRTITAEEFVRWSVYYGRKAQRIEQSRIESEQKRATSGRR